MTTRLEVVVAEQLTTEEAIDQALLTADNLLDVGLAQIAVVQGLLETNYGASDALHVKLDSGETLVDTATVSEVLNNARLQMFDGLLQLREVHMATQARSDSKGKLRAA